MLLAIDAGNTNTVFAVFGDDDTVRGEWRSATKTDRTADELGVWLDQLLRLNGLRRDEIDAAIIATVVPAIEFDLKSLCRRYFQCDPLVVGSPGVEIGINVLLDRPEEIGADRLVNTVAAHVSYGGPLIIVDFGTATTFDIIDTEGNYTGGVIAPGINLSLEALHMASAKLPRVAIERPEKIIGKNTIEAMQSGIFWGYVSMIEGMVDRIRGEFGMHMDVIATGGLAPLFTDATACIKGVDSDLTLRGLLAIHKLNQPK